MRRLVGRLRSYIEQNFTDLVFVAGLIAIAAGCLMVSFPLGCVVGGVLLVLSAIFYDGSEDKS